MKAKTFKLGTLHDSLIKDRIVCGLDSKNVRERLLRNNELTLELAINTVRAAETSKTQIESQPSVRSGGSKREQKTPEAQTSIEKPAPKNNRAKTERKTPVWALWFSP